MDTKKIAVIVVAAFVVVAGAAAYVMMEKKSDPDTLKVAYLTKGYFPFIVGFDQGFFDDLSFNCEPLIVTGSGQTAVDAVLRGDAQMAATGEAPFVNTLGKNPGEIIGLCSYTTSEGSAGGHRWIAVPSMSGKIPSMALDAEGEITNGQDVADAMAQVTAAGQGRGDDGKLVIGLIYGSTTLTTFKRWCNLYDITYSEKATDVADVQIKIFDDGATLMAAFGLNTLDLMGASEPYPTQVLDTYAGTYEISNSTVVNITSSSVLCTTKAYYEKYTDQMMEFLEALAEVNEWISNNQDRAAEICAPISGMTESAIKSSLNSADLSIIWKDHNAGAMVETAEFNGYAITKDDFLASCPHRNIINGWYD